MPADRHVPLTTRTPFPAWDRTRTAIPNLSDGRLRVSATISEARDTDYFYAISLERADGRRPTKVQIAWASAVVEAITYVYR